MKISGSKKINSDKESLWLLISNIGDYPNWQSHCGMASGTLEIDKTLEFQYSLPQFPKIKRKAKVTAVMDKKYLSFMEVAPRGLWWWNKEFVLRIVEEEGNLLLHYEIYCYGLRFRWFKDKIKAQHELEVLYFLDAVKEKFKSPE